MLQRFRTLKGVVASLRTYYGRREHRVGLDRLYGRFVRSGDLVFDVGAHVGDRVGAFRRLGARVVAVEPQPQLVKVLALLYGRDRAVTIEPVVIGRTDGFAEMLINHANPTVSTASADFVAAAAGAPGWEQETWTERLEITMTTLDALIARHGVPAFIKIDVEGFEAEALAGLSAPVAALSFEFTTIQRDVAVAALERCAALGYQKFDASLGESHAFVHGAWQTAEQMKVWIAGLPQEANSGDVYAIR
ncbi:FkbM family methyltransferase [Rhodoplanes roseus]|uniref:Methyltransferase FkbM n=1 Tax=Rhodoplanes roseus TaxID=29409 RepID=A0A327KC36_9BRAD|nr:FkbM family methyltransferase [Rhodoplanes roseus]RAI35205.1 methyltransferase FkbM [Rhodoplanes roseus]